MKIRQALKLLKASKRHPFRRIPVGQDNMGEQLKACRVRDRWLKNYKKTIKVRIGSPPMLSMLMDNTGSMDSVQDSMQDSLDIALSLLLPDGYKMKMPLEFPPWPNHFFV